MGLAIIDAIQLEMRSLSKIQFNCLTVYFCYYTNCKLLLVMFKYNHCKTISKVHNMTNQKTAINRKHHENVWKTVSPLQILKVR